MQIRGATPGDIPELDRLIELSVRGLQGGDYSPAQIEGALGHVVGVDRQLIADGALLVAEADGQIIGCGGWSARSTLFGPDAAAVRDARLLDPAKDAARIRAFFVHPDWARRGVGTKLLEACEAAARARGFSRFELMATLTGVHLYSRRGFVAVETCHAPLPGGAELPMVRMAKPGV